jgi:hypothetical protein
MSGRGRGRGRKPASESRDVKEEKVKKVSKKKQFSVVAVVTPDGIQGNLQTEIRRPLIVHLPIQSKDIECNDMPISYDPHPPNVPEPYDMYSDNPFSDIVEHIIPASNSENIIVDREQPVQQVQQVQPVQQQSQSTSDFYNTKATFLVQFKDSSEIKAIPYTSDSACHWCCHTFTTRPVVLPLRDQGEYIQVFGNFCCPECSMSYLFDMRQDSHTRWEQLSLLFRIYGEACNGKICPAPPRNTLKLFGGAFTIEEYRSIIRSYKVRVDVHLPPMVSLLSTMDTKPIDFYDTALTKNVSETVKERLQKAEEVLRLRRTKPLKAWESTLDACINLKIKPATNPIQV